MKKTIVITAVVTLLALVAACAPKQEIAPSPEPIFTAAPTAAPTPRPTLEYRMDPQKPNPNGDYYPEASEALMKKVNEIFVLTTNPQNAVFENILGLYEYMTRNIAFKEEGTADAAEAILSGSASKTGFTRAYQYLLDQIGAEAHIATANDGSACWVMAKMSDGFYHFDPAEDAKQTHGQSLEYFAMNDEQRWGGGKIDGWYLGSDEMGGKYEPPKNEKQTYTFLQNVKVGYGVDFATDYLYFADVSQNNELVRYNYQTGVEETLYGKQAGSMVYYRGQLYYSDLNQRNQLFKLEVATGQAELVDSVFVTRMMFKNGTLIYFDDVSSSEKGIQLS